MFRNDGQRNMASYLRATCNTSDVLVSRQRKLARLCGEQPAVGDGLLGDDAEQHPLPGTAHQRRFDAIEAVSAAAAASPEGRALPEPTTRILIDEQSLHETFTHADITLPNGDVIDADGLIDEDDTLLDTLATQLVNDPEAFRNRRCETSTGAKIHPIVSLSTALAGHIRRVVVDSDGVVIDHGTRQRLCTGNARAAAMPLATTGAHPGCRTSARLCQLDHDIGWSDGGTTDQRNAEIECGPHNRFNHRERWRTRRDSCGRIYTIRADGTIMLLVGERPADLSIDEMNEAARAWFAALRRP